MKERIEARAAMPNSSCAIAGRMLRSSPTMPPTNALTRTRSENCLQFSRNPRRTSVAVTALGWVGAAVLTQDLLHFGGFWRHLRERVHELLHRGTEQRIPALLERNGTRGFAAQACPAARAREVPGKDFEIAGEVQELRVQAG